MVVFRVLGWLLLAMAVAAVVHDCLAWWAEGSFHLLRFGDLWSQLDARSLAQFQGAAQRHLSAVLWTWIAWPFLRVPVLPAFLVVGLICLWLGERGGRPRETAFFIGARPPRRRRSRGLN